MSTKDPFLSLNGDVSELQADVSALETDVTGLQTDVTTLDTNLTALTATVTTLNTTVTTLSTALTALTTRVTALEAGNYGRVTGTHNHTIVASGLFTAAGTISVQYNYSSQTRIVVLHRISITGAVIAAVGSAASYSFNLGAAVPALPSGRATASLMMLTDGANTFLLKVEFRDGNLIFTTPCGDAAANEVIRNYPLVTASIAGLTMGTGMQTNLVYTY